MAEDGAGKTKYEVLRKLGSDSPSDMPRWEWLPETFSVNGTEQATQAAANKYGAGVYRSVPASYVNEDEYEMENQPRAVRVKKPA